MTAPLSHIACWIHGARSGAVAVESARHLAGSADARLSLLLGRPYEIVVEEEDGATVHRRDDPEASARQWRRVQNDPADAEPVFLRGDPAAGICAWAERELPDIIVVGADAGIPPGATAAGFVDHLLERAPCPVLVVRAPE